MAESLRALVVGKTAGRVGDTLLHLVPVGAEATLCRAYRAEQMATGTTPADRVCPACLAALHLRWLSQEEAIST